MSFDYTDIFPRPPRDAQQFKLAAFGIGAGILMGYNWDLITAFAKGCYTVVSETILDALWGDDDEVKAGRPSTRFIVGVGVVVRQGSKILLGRRLNSHGGGDWAVPGGHLEPGETFLQAGVRELLEETGISVQSPTDLSGLQQAYIHPQTSIAARKQHADRVELDYQQFQKQLTSYPTADGPALPVPFVPAPSTEVWCPEENIQLIVRMVVVDKPEGQEPRLLENHKCEGWHWVEWSDLCQLAHYHHRVAQFNSYQAMSPSNKAMLVSMASAASPSSPVASSKSLDTSPDGSEATLPGYSQSTPPVVHPVNDLNADFTATGPACAFFPSLPRFSPDCVLTIDDHLFAPMQSFVLSGFDPTTA